MLLRIDMKKKNSFGTKTVTMTAIFSALGVVFLYIGSIFDFLDLTAAMAASFIVIFAVIEGGGVVPWMIYAGTAIISLLLLPNKYPAVIYLFFAGLYPMVKSYSERLSMPVALTIKLLFTNAMLTVIILIAKYLLAVPDDELGLRVEVDHRNEKLGYKIREAQLQRIPYMLVVGDRDVENGVVSVRSRKGGDLGAMTLDAFKEKILEEVKTRARD